MAIKAYQLIKYTVHNIYNGKKKRGRNIYSKQQNYENKARL